jgi:hypothetical protein
VDLGEHVPSLGEKGPVVNRLLAVRAQQVANHVARPCVLGSQDSSCGGSSSPRPSGDSRKRNEYSRHAASHPPPGSVPGRVGGGPPCASRLARRSPRFGPTCSFTPRTNCCARASPTPSGLTSLKPKPAPTCAETCTACKVCCRPRPPSLPGCC